MPVYADLGQVKRAAEASGQRAMLGVGIRAAFKRCEFVDHELHIGSTYRQRDVGVYVVWIVHPSQLNPSIRELHLGRLVGMANGNDDVAMAGEVDRQHRSILPVVRVAGRVDHNRISLRGSLDRRALAGLGDREIDVGQRDCRRGAARRCTGARLPRGTYTTGLTRGAGGARVPTEKALQLRAKMGDNRRGHPGRQSPEGDGPRRIPECDYQLPRMWDGPKGVLTALVSKVQRECAHVEPSGWRGNRQLHACGCAALSESDGRLEPAD